MRITMRQMCRIGTTKLFAARFVSLLTQLLRDRSGAAGVYAALLLPVLAGTALLAVDASRLFNLQTALQKGADALALAGAAELDRKPDSITRANAAIANLVVNKDRFGTSTPATITTSSIRYLSS